jgi:exonuclease V gamma subunit
MAEATATHTGRIKSSSRITKALQKAITRDIGVEYNFEDGTQATIEPSLAKRALAYYQKLSPFEKAKVAKEMRTSFKSFLSIVKR